MSHYEICVITGGIRVENNDNTTNSSINLEDSHLYVCIVGEMGESEYLQIGKITPDVQIVAGIQLQTDVGALEEILVGHDNEDGLGIFIKSIVVTNITDSKFQPKYDFINKFWLQDDLALGLHRALRLKATPRMEEKEETPSPSSLLLSSTTKDTKTYEYTVIVGTGMQRNAVAGNMSLMMTIIGSSDESGDIELVKIPPATPMEAEITIKTVMSLGVLKSVLLGLEVDEEDPKNENNHLNLSLSLPDVFVEKLVVVDETERTEYTFRAKSWIQDENHPEIPNALELVPNRVKKLYRDYNAESSLDSTMASQTPIKPSWGLSQLFPESQSFVPKKEEQLIIQKPTTIESRSSSPQPNKPLNLYEIKQPPSAAATLLPIDDQKLKIDHAQMLRTARSRAAVFDSGRLENYGVSKLVLENDLISFVNHSGLLEPPEGIDLAAVVQPPPKWSPSIDMFTYSYKVEITTGAIKDAVSSTTLLVCLVGNSGESGDWEVGSAAAGNVMTANVLVPSWIGDIRHVVVGMTGVSPSGSTALYLEGVSVLDVHKGVKYTTVGNSWLQCDNTFDEIVEPCSVLEIATSEQVQMAENPNIRSREVVYCRFRGLSRGGLVVATSNFVEWTEKLSIETPICEILNISYNDSGTCAVVAIGVMVNYIIQRAQTGRLLSAFAARTLCSKNLGCLKRLSWMLSDTSKSRSCRRRYGGVVKAGRTVGASARRFWFRLSYCADYWACVRIQGHLNMKISRKRYIEGIEATMVLGKFMRRKGCQLMHVQMRVLPWALRRTAESKVWLDFKLISLLDRRQLSAQVLQRSCRRAIPHLRYVRIIYASHTIIGFISRHTLTFILNHSEQQWAAYTIAAFLRRSLVEFGYESRGYEEISSPSPEERARAGRLIVHCAQRVVVRREYFRERYREEDAVEMLQALMMRRIDRRRYIESESSAQTLKKGEYVSRRPLSALLALARVDRLIQSSKASDSSAIWNKGQTSLSLQFVINDGDEAVPVAAANNNQKTQKQNGKINVNNKQQQQPSGGQKGYFSALTNKKGMPSNTAAPLQQQQQQPRGFNNNNIIPKNSKPVISQSVQQKKIQLSSNNAVKPWQSSPSQTATSFGLEEYQNDKRHSSPEQDRTKRRQQFLQAQVKTRIASTDDSGGDAGRALPPINSSNYYSDNDEDNDDSNRRKKKPQKKRSSSKRSKSEASKYDDNNDGDDDEPQQFWPVENEYIGMLSREIEKQLQQNLMAEMPNGADGWNQLNIVPQEISKAKRTPNLTNEMMFPALKAAIGKQQQQGGAGGKASMAVPSRKPNYDHHRPGNGGGNVKGRPDWVDSSADPHDAAFKYKVSAIASQLTKEATDRIRESQGWF